MLQESLQRSNMLVVFSGIPMGCRVNSLRPFTCGQYGVKITVALDQVGRNISWTCQKLSLCIKKNNKRTKMNDGIIVLHGPLQQVGVLKQLL